ncbi:MAG: zf-HC2 domain-containing protein [Bacillota bacterium]|nr:zf-HC2 domain-containing protein [Bacillota bacterium]
MKCEEVYQWLQAYLDTEVTAEEERMVEKHIRGCVHCRRRLVELSQTINQIQKAGQLTPRQDFTKRLMERLEQEKRERG